MAKWTDVPGEWRPELTIHFVSSGCSYPAQEGGGADSWVPPIYEDHRRFVGMSIEGHKVPRILLPCLYGWIKQQPELIELLDAVELEESRPEPKGG